MNSIKLVECSDSVIARGQVFRVPASWPYESIVDFMVVDIPDDSFGHSLVVASGNKSGLVLVHLPLESCASDEHGISREWVISNWEKWIYPDCSVEDVYLVDSIEVPTELTTR